MNDLKNLKFFRSQLSIDRQVLHQRDRESRDEGRRNLPRFWRQERHRRNQTLFRRKSPRSLRETGKGRYSRSDRLHETILHGLERAADSAPLFRQIVQGTVLICFRTFESLPLLLIIA